MRVQRLADLLREKRFDLLILSTAYSKTSLSNLIESDSRGIRVFTLGFPFAPRNGPTLDDVIQDLHLRATVLMGSREISNALRNRQIDLLPLNMSDLPGYLEQLIKSEKKVCVLTPISEPSKTARVSLGCDSAYQGALLKKKEIFKIGEINDHQPWTYSDNSLGLANFDAIVETSEELPVLATPQIRDSCKKIGEFVSELIDDKSTIQLGIGSIPQAITKHLGNKNNLGFHSGLLNESAANLIDAGVITNRYKEDGTGKSISCLAFGSHRSFYDWLNENKKIKMRSIDFVHNRMTIASISNFISINSAFQIDLFGQINAEMSDGKQISGVGGQMDFVVGSRLSKGGKSIMVLESTNEKLAISKIVPLLNPNNVVTTPRSEVDFIVTEWGAACLKGKSIRERALLLIDLAHPEFRHELKREATKLSLI